MTGDGHLAAIVANLEGRGIAFERADDCPWLDDVEARFGRRLPAPYRELVRGFRWAGFEVEDFEAFSNVGDGSGFDISDAPFKDPALAQWLIRQGLLQIGRPSSGAYDPVCFDTRSHGKRPPIVRIDHEDILLGRKRVRVTRVADSFESLILGKAV